MSEWPGYRQAGFGRQGETARGFLIGERLAFSLREIASVIELRSRTLNPLDRFLSCRLQMNAALKDPILIGRRDFRPRDAVRPDGGTGAVPNGYEKIEALLFAQDALALKIVLVFRATGVDLEIRHRNGLRAMGFRPSCGRLAQF